MKQFTTDNNWTLFLDRDGVINHEQHMSYVNTWDDFKFYDGVKESLKILSSKFKYIIIITNQRGVGRGITTIENLKIIHKNMIEEIAEAGGKIDCIYFSPDLDFESPNRKPNTGMALQAKNDFADIDFTRSVMVGNNISDMEFGRNIGSKTIFILTTSNSVPPSLTYINGAYKSLFQFAESL